MINKLKTIILSRFRKNQTESFVKERRDICTSCEFNSLNRGKLKPKEIFIKELSDFYSWITGNKEEDTLGGCTICGCSVFYKTSEEVSQCAHTPPKWTRIDIKNK